jgi:hypothetical protein
MSQEAVSFQFVSALKQNTIQILQATQSIDNIPPWKGKAQFDEENAHLANNTGLNKNWFKRL